MLGEAQLDLSIQKSVLEKRGKPAGKKKEKAIIMEPVGEKSGKALDNLNVPLCVIQRGRHSERRNVRRQLSSPWPLPRAKGSEGMGGLHDEGVSPVPFTTHKVL